MNISRRNRGIAMKLLGRTLAAMAVALTLGFARTASAANELDPELRAIATPIAVMTCANCHGPRGVSFTPRFPNLAAQPVNYLTSQLKAFKTHMRQDPDALAYMWGIAASLNDRQISALAEYYSAQDPAPPSASSGSSKATQGKYIFENGIPSQQVAACSGCHGAKGEGNMDIPRLASQRSQYFLSQMRSFKLNQRSAPFMTIVAKRLNDEELQALAEYIESR